MMSPASMWSITVPSYNITFTAAGSLFTEGGRPDVYSQTREKKFADLRQHASNAFKKKQNFLKKTLQSTELSFILVVAVT